MNNLEIEPKNTKLIAIGQDGKNTLEIIEDKLKGNVDFEQIAINQDVDKDYVRNLLDGVDILFLTYSTEDRRAKDIVKAIGYMAKERRILAIGLNSSMKEDKDELNIDRELKINKYNTDKITSLINIMIESISDFCMINIDLTDIKEAVCTDKGFKYSYEEFDKSQTTDEIVNTIIECITEEGSEFIEKKGILFVEMDKNYCDDNMLIVLNEILTKIQCKSADTYEMIFSLSVKENCDEKIKIGLIYN